MVYVVVLVAALLTGCTPNFKGMVEAMAKSDRSWCLAASGYGVDIKIGGSGLGEGDMNCSGAGLSLKAQGAQVGVPINLVPQLSIGQPTLSPEPVRPAPRTPPQAPRATPQAAPAPLGDVEVLRISAPTEPRARGDLTDAELRDVLHAVRAMHGGGTR